MVRTAGTWTTTTALTEFTGRVHAVHHNINSVVIANDETGAPIISYLQSHGVKPNTFPTTGQDATLVGLQNVLSGYQCGTVYKPIYLEAQAAVALALYCPPRGQDGSAGAPQCHGDRPDDADQSPSVGYLTPQWVTTGEHEGHDHQGQLRAGSAVVHREVRGALQGRGDLVVRGS